MRDTVDEVMSERGPAKVAIVCVTHNSADLIAGFLCRALDGQVEGTHRIVVVDSGSTDDTPAVASAVSPAVDVCVMARNCGYAAGINVGIDHVRRTGGAAAFVVANPDVLLGADAVQPLLEALALDDVGVSCPMIVDQRGDRDDSLSRLPNVWTGFVSAMIGARLTAALGLPVEVLRDERDYRHAHPVGWACGGLLAISAECIDRVGLWNEAYFMYEEEVDYCERLSRHGLLIWYTPGAVVVRAVSSDANAPWRHALSQINRVRRESMSGRGSLRRAQFVIENILRVRRARSRAALWAVLSNATPQQVMNRYRPGSDIAVGPAVPAAPAPYGVLAGAAVRHGDAAAPLDVSVGGG